MNYMAIKDETRERAKAIRARLAELWPDAHITVQPAVNALYLQWTDAPEPREVREALSELRGPDTLSILRATSI